MQKIAISLLLFRTYDSVDAIVKKKYTEERETSEKQYEIESYLDESPNGRYLNHDIFTYLKSFFFEKDKDLYELTVFCIMPNHVHILFKQNRELKNIMKILKGSSSIVINKLMNRTGKFWRTVILIK